MNRWQNEGTTGLPARDRPAAMCAMTHVVSASALGTSESLYLDLVRALAAFFVVLDHAPALFDMPHTPMWGHQAVVVFFVLSGYVISYVSDTKEPTGRAFVVARLARLWSVLVPAMVLTVACEAAGRGLGTDPRGFDTSPVDHPVIRIAAVLVFLSETWVSILPLSNGVVWSLCVEFWYYMIFAAWMFIPVGRTRTAVLVVALLLSGFKALLLLPVWLMGVALHRWQRPRCLGPGFALVCWAIGAIVIAWVLAFRAYDWPIESMRIVVNPWLFQHLAQARAFWFDWFLGFFVAANLFGARELGCYLPLRFAARAIRWSAGISFAAYLFHMPLLHLSAAFLPRSQGWTAVAFTLSVIMLLGPSVERSKRWWQRRLGAIAARLPAAAH
jgi:peptidoglycan/LPS O-acetylase OafA/YrhL